MQSGSWSKSLPTRVKEKFVVKDTLMPKGPSGSRGGMNVADMIAMNAKTKYAKESWELVKHLTFVEMRWLDWGFEGRPVDDPWGDQRDGRWHLGPDETPPEEHKESQDSGRTMSGTVTRCEPPHVLAFTFDHYGKSEATFELTSQGANVRPVR